MTTLPELIGPNASNPGEIAGYSTDAVVYSLGGNDTYGDCVFVAPCNQLDLSAFVNGAPFTIGDAEALLFYEREAGFTKANPASDHGAIVTDMLAYWSANGWPSDPESKPVGWCAIEVDQIHQAIHSLGAVVVWALLPRIDDDWDFSDLSITRGVDGTGGHCMLMVRSGPDGYQVITWAERRTVTHAWWAKYGKGQIAVLVPGWKVR
jgi:hypothetical protein